VNPADFPPWQTWYFNRWEQAKVTEKILPVVRAQLRVQEGRNPEPSAGLIDSQSVQGAEAVGRDTRGYENNCTRGTQAYIAAFEERPFLGAIYSSRPGNSPT